MSDWQAKRFWKAASTAEVEGGFSVALDGRVVKTPARATLILPTQRMAEAIAAEWDAQSELINPLSMPTTRSANAAIDKVRPQRNEVVEMLAGYGDSDLLCYRAAQPEALVNLQSSAWDPLLAWSAETLNASLICAEGVMHVPQNPAALARLREQVDAFSDFELAAFHDLVSLSGSLVLAFAVVHGRLSVSESWATSRVDEDFQISQWGEDEEAAEQAAIKKSAFAHAARFHEMCLN